MSSIKTKQTIKHKKDSSKAYQFQYNIARTSLTHLAEKSKNKMSIQTFL